MPTIIDEILNNSNGFTIVHHNETRNYTQIRGMLRGGRRKIANNTYLTDEHNYCIAMRLHGNIVAGFHPNHIMLHSAGWHTHTTKNRLNLALQLAGLTQKSIWQEDWEWYYGDTVKYTIFSDGMLLRYDGTVRQRGG